jgi:hypothetical protein
MDHICSFSGSVASLTAKQARDPEIVLAVLKKDPMVSTWDMSTHGLWKTIYALKDKGLIQEVNVPYPWCKFIVVEKQEELK